MDNLQCPGLQELVHVFFVLSFISPNNLISSICITNLSFIPSRRVLVHYLGNCAVIERAWNTRCLVLFVLREGCEEQVEIIRDMTVKEDVKLQNLGVCEALALILGLHGFIYVCYCCKYVRSNRGTQICSSKGFWRIESSYVKLFCNGLIDNFFGNIYKSPLQKPEKLGICNICTLVLLTSLIFDIFSFCLWNHQIGLDLFSLLLETLRNS